MLEIQNRLPQSRACFTKRRKVMEYTLRRFCTGVKDAAERCKEETHKLRQNKGSQLACGNTATFENM
jgi:hypothetical protein